MIQRLHELQTKNLDGHCVNLTETPQVLPPDYQVHNTQTSSLSKGHGDQTYEKARSEDQSKTSTKPLSPLRPAQENGITSTQTPPPGSVLQNRNSSSKRTEEKQGGRRRGMKENNQKAKQKTCEESDSSNPPISTTASWSEMSTIVIGLDYCLSPLSSAMEQRLILQYLTPLGEHQEVDKPSKKLYLTIFI